MVAISNRFGRSRAHLAFSGPSSVEGRVAGPGVWVRIGVFLLLAALICCRMPDVLLHGRLWAEEGLFYQNAWTMPAWSATFLEYGGYLNIVANGGAVLARHLVSLADAPKVMTGVALLFQLLPGFLIVTSRATWLRSPVAMAAAVIALGAAPLAEEVWLETLHSQYQLALCAALLLSFDDEPPGWLRWMRRFVLLLAPLSGMLAVLLAPLWFARAALERSRSRAIDAAFLIVGSAIQVGLFYSPSGGAALERSASIWPGIVVYTLFFRHLVLPVVGETIGDPIGSGIEYALKSSHPPMLPLVLLVVVGLVAGLASLRQRRYGSVWLLASGCLIAMVSYATGLRAGGMFLHPQLLSRYSVTPEVIFAWTVISIAATPPFDWVARGFAVAAAWLCLVGTEDYLHSPGRAPARGADWALEAARWERDPDHLIRLWPDRWMLQLSADHGPVWLKVRPPELASPVPHDDRMR